MLNTHVKICASHGIDLSYCYSEAHAYERLVDCLIESEKALRNLVYLKNLKDEANKTEDGAWINQSDFRYYNAQKPKAWREAVNVLQSHRAPYGANGINEPCQDEHCRAERIAGNPDPHEPGVR